MPSQFLEAEELSFIPVSLLVVFDHPNEVKDFMNEGSAAKPFFHQHAGCLNAGFQHNIKDILKQSCKFFQICYNSML